MGKRKIAIGGPPGTNVAGSVGTIDSFLTRAANVITKEMALTEKRLSMETEKLARGSVGHGLSQEENTIPVEERRPIIPSITTTEGLMGDLDSLICSSAATLTAGDDLDCPPTKRK